MCIFPVEKATKVIRRICTDEIQTLHQEDEKVSHLLFLLLYLYQGGIKLLSDSFLDVIRPGEWGDHVTLQAAADRVSFLFRKNNIMFWVYYKTAAVYKYTSEILSSLE